MSRFEKAKASYVPVEEEERGSARIKPVNDPNLEPLRLELQDALRAYLVKGLHIAPEDAEILTVRGLEDVGENNHRLACGEKRAYLFLGHDKPQLERRLLQAQVAQTTAIEALLPERPANDFLAKWGAQLTGLGQSYTFNPYEDKNGACFGGLQGVLGGVWHHARRQHLSAYAGLEQGKMNFDYDRPDEPIVAGHSLRDLVEILNEDLFLPNGIEPVDYVKLYAKSVRGMDRGSNVARLEAEAGRPVEAGRTR